MCVCVCACVRACVSVAEYSAYIKTTSTTTTTPVPVRSTQSIVFQPPYAERDRDIPNAIFPPVEGRGRNSRPINTFKPITYPDPWISQQSGHGNVSPLLLIKKERKKERKEMVEVGGMDRTIVY